MPDAQIERVLLAIASGTGMALLPESVAERYAAPGVRFLPLGGAAPTFATGVVTRRDTEHMPTVAFLRAFPKPRAVMTSGSPVAAVA
jgi:DNA-binding transcriptional LysR family regulator